MNAITNVSEPTGRLLPAVDVLAIRAETRAFLWSRWIIANMPDAVDDLQVFAEQSGLVEHLGRDAVQAIIAAPFAKLRKEADALEIAGQAKRRRADECDAEPADPGIVRRTYCTPRSTIDAFLYVARNESIEYLARWLKDHPFDAPQLLKIWKLKCTAPST